MARQYTRKNFLINKRFQFGFVIFSVTFMGLLSATVGLVIPWLFQAHANKYLLIIAIILITAMFITLCIAFTHSIAGPMYKMGKVMREAVDGNLPDAPVRLRESDYFKWIAEDFSNLLAIMKKHENDKKETLSDLKDLKVKVEENQLSEKECAEILDEMIGKIDFEES
jgi:hypothetical protein